MDDNHLLSLIYWVSAITVTFMFFSTVLKKTKGLPPMPLTPLAMATLFFLTFFPLVNTVAAIALVLTQDDL